MATKTIAVKVEIQGDAQLAKLQANFDNVRRARINLNKAEKAGTITAKEANAQRAQLNVQLKANRNALTDHQNALLKNNNALKKNSGFVGGIKKGMAQWATTMIGVTAAISGITALVKGAVKIFTDFEKANSQLAAVTRASAEEMKFMKDQAKELGSTTAFTASQVTELQTEFAKLGFPTGEILQMTEATLSGAAALGSELGEQASLTGALLKQFGLDADEAGRVNDVLAESAASSALDFGKLSTALPIVGATANTAGVSIERTTALLGTLSDRGIDASTAGTSLRNIFLELSKQGLTFEEAMEQINTSTDKNATAMELFGKRGATAGVILAETGGTIDDLEKTLIESEGAAAAMAETMLDNVAGSATKAASAYEGFILSLEDGDGAISRFAQSAIDEFTNILSSLTELNNFEFDKLTDPQSLRGFSESLNDLGGTLGGIVNPALGQLSDDIDTKFNASLNAADEALKNLTDEQIKNADVLKELGTRYVNQGLSVDEAIARVGAEVDARKALSTTTEEGSTAVEDNTKATEENNKSRGKSLTLLEQQLKLQQDFKKELEGARGIQDEAVSLEDEDNLDELLEFEIEKNEAILEVDQEFLNQKLEQEMAALDAQTEAEKKAAEEQIQIQNLKRDAFLASSSIVADALNVGASLAAEGSVQQKALASAATLIQTYQAAQAAYLSQLSIPTPSAPVRAAAAAGVAIASGLANVAKINSTKLAKGGVLEGPSHADGGIPFSVDGQLGFEAEGGEAIINKRSTEMFAPLLSQINEAGGGVAFKRGGLVSKFQNGGLTPTTSGVTAAQQSLTQNTVQLEEFSDSIVAGINDKEVINVATSTTNVASDVINIENEATF